MNGVLVEVNQRVQVRRGRYDGGNDVFMHISAVERSGIATPNEGDKISYELERDERRGRVSAVNLRVE